MDAFRENWNAGAHSLDDFDAELSTVAVPQQKCRKSERKAVALEAGLRQRGASGISVRILDLSTTGFRAATHLELAAGTDVWLRLPKLEACHAKVVWSGGNLVGCAFERPLHPAVLQMIVDAARSR